MYLFAPKVPTYEAKGCSPSHKLEKTRKACYFSTNFYYMTNVEKIRWTLLEFYIKYTQNNVFSPSC